MKHECFAVKDLTEDEVVAIKRLGDGQASEFQQRLALAVIVNKFSRAQDLPYIPGSFDETAFINGRAFVGQKILRVLNIPIGKLKEVTGNETV